MTVTSSHPEFRISDPARAPEGRQEIEQVELDMPGLMALRRDLAPSRPLAGVRITVALHLTSHAAVLVETLVALGAEVRWASCKRRPRTRERGWDPASTQDQIAAAAVVGPTGTPEAPAGVSVFAWKEFDWQPFGLEDYWECIEQALTWPDADGPDLLLDSGGEATLLVHQGVELETTGTLRGVEGSEELQLVAELLQRSLERTPGKWSAMARTIRGVSEEVAVAPLHALAQAGELLFPAIDVDHAPTKARFDDEYGLRHAVVDGLNRGTDMLIGGKIAVVCGYGGVGRAAADALRGQGARVVVTEADPVRALEALMAGYQVARIEEVLDDADLFLTATGGRDVITAAHMRRMKHRAVVANFGHYGAEVDMEGLAAEPGIVRRTVKPLVDEWRHEDGRVLIVLSDGRLVNFGNGPGLPSFVMSAIFTSQVLAQLELHARADDLGRTVTVLPARLDAEVARLHLEPLGGHLTELTAAQVDYLAFDADRPFPPSRHRG